MTLDARESSVRNGAPYELYKFVRGNPVLFAPVWGAVYGYTSGDTAMGSRSVLYPKADISRGPITRGEDRRAVVEITLPRDSTIAELIDASGVPLEPIAVTIFRGHHGEAADGEWTIFAGQVMSAKWRGPKVTLSCETPEALLDRQGLRLTVQRTCPFMLYDRHCGIAGGTFNYAGTASAVSGAVVTVGGVSTNAGADKTKFVGGYIQFLEPIDGAYEYGGTIIAQDGSDHLTLAAPCVGITAGIDVLVFAGCDKSLTTCHDRFSNTVHYGGFPGLPVRNPFKGAGLDGNLQ